MSEISVCIPTYEYKGEGVKYLNELFKSLSIQTFQDFDVVISDHSKDTEIMNFCRECDYDFEITYIRNENGRGYQSTNTNWTEMMLEGNNHLGRPSCVAFLNEYVMNMDENIKLLIDTELYHRMRMEHGIPEFISDILIANREHDNRVSAGGIDYNAVIQGSDGKQWVVNREELQHVYEKHKDFFILKKYPDEN